VIEHVLLAWRLWFMMRHGADCGGDIPSHGFLPDYTMPAAASATSMTLIPTNGAMTPPTP
jgi:hypothetical protein